MSILWENGECILIDSAKAESECYRKVSNWASSEPHFFFPSPDEYFIYEPFRMDSQCGPKTETDDATTAASTTFTNSQKKKFRRERKRMRKKLECGDLDDDVDIAKLQTALASVKASSIGQEYFSGYVPSISGENNGLAREFAKKSADSSCLREYCSRLVTEEMNIEMNNLTTTFFHSVYRSNISTCTTVNVLGHKFVLPPCSSFLMSDIHFAYNLLPQLGLFDLVVVDPPWENRSVKRLKTYSHLSEDELRLIPVNQLLHPGTGVCAIWCTNAPRHRRLCRESLLPTWKLQLCATYIWLKVTRLGEPVQRLTGISQHAKRSYEVLYICRRRHSYEGAKVDKVMLDENANRVLVSVPSAIHSKKPALQEVLQRWLPEQPRCLELFARSLTASWTSWGNEVLKLQHVDYFISEKNN